jgi:CubicO group peptidase (beta-lactamase class C family)
MNKIYFGALLLITAVAASAQISEPRLVSPGFFVNNGQKYPASQTRIPSRSQGTLNHHSSRSPSFDPAWADRFQTVLDSVCLATNMKGVSLAVLSPDQGLLTCVSGISVPGVPITSEMRFGIGSNTKLFVAVTLAALQEQGILSLDDPLYQWTPSHPFVDSTTTIRQLLSHQTGIFDCWNDRVSMLTDSIPADTGHFWTSEETLGTIGSPHFLPGNGYSYSNTNYLLAGMVIESATSTTWFQKLHDVIFDPQDMDSTFVGAFEPRNGPVSAEYDIFNNMVITNSPMTAEYSQANAFGAMLSTAQEMAEWYSALLTGSIVSDSSLLQILQFESSSWYGLGIAEGGYYDHVSYNHTGGMMGYASMVWYDVQTQSILCILMNDRTYDFNARVIPLLNVLYDDFPKKQNDAGITAISSPKENICGSEIYPYVVLKNFGSESLTSVTIQYKIEQGATASYSWTGTLTPGATAFVGLPGIMAGEGAHTLTCWTSLPNGAPEGYSFNDSLRGNFISNTLPAVSTTLSEDFEGNSFPPSGWIQNTDSFLHWGQTPLARFTGSFSAVRGNYSDGNMGANYDLDLPVIHIDEGTHPELTFWYAYAMYPGMFGDSLQVLASTDCGVTWQRIYDKGGWGLHTATTTSNQFYPQSVSNWKQESLPLAEFPGDILLKFRSVCGYSNNLFLDDVEVSFPTITGIQLSPFEITVYPNPARDHFTVSVKNSSDAHISTEINDLIGNSLLVLDHGRWPSGTHQFTIHAETYLPGVYILTVRLNEEKFTTKLLIE